MRPHLPKLLLLALVVVLAYANTLRPTGFALDNQFLILEDPRLHAAAAENLKFVFTQDYWWPKFVSGLYRPLTTLTYLFNYAVLGNGEVATGYHALNLLLHAGNAALVYALAFATMRRRWTAFFVAALFAAHPTATESVTNIIGRADLLAALCVLGALCLHVAGAAREGRARWPWLAATGLVAALGMFCKENAVVVLPVIALHDFVYRWRPLRPRALAAGWAALLPAYAAFFAVRARVFAELTPPELRFVDNPILGADFVAAKLTAFKVIGKYLALALWPQHLSADYSYDQIPLVTPPYSGWADWQAFVALAAVAALVAHALWSVRRRPDYAFFSLFFFATLVPTSNLLVPIGAIFGDRFLYLPSVGFAGVAVIAVSAGCRRLVPELQPVPLRLPPDAVARAVLALVVVLYAVRTVDRNFDWSDDLTLWSHDVTVSPDSFKTHMSLGSALSDALPPPGSERDAAFERAIAAAERSIAILEKRPLAAEHGATTPYLLLGTLYLQKGDDAMLMDPEGATSAAWWQRSVEVLERAVGFDRAFNAENRAREVARGKRAEDVPDVGNHVLYWNLATSHLRLGQRQRALDAYEYVARLTPSNTDAYLGIATVNLETGFLDAAQVALVQVLLLDPVHPDALRIAAELYPQLDGGECAVRQVGGRTQLNQSCPVVRRHLCAAHAALERRFADAAQPQAAEHFAAGARSLGCPAQG